jgi:hypothetical protein
VVPAASAQREPNVVGSEPAPWLPQRHASWHHVDTSASYGQKEGGEKRVPFALLMQAIERLRFPQLAISHLYRAPVPLALSGQLLSKGMLGRQTVAWAWRFLSRPLCAETGESHGMTLAI